MFDQTVRFGSSVKSGIRQDSVKIEGHQTEPNFRKMYSSVRFGRSVIRSYQEFVEVLGFGQNGGLPNRTSEKCTDSVVRFGSVFGNSVRFGSSVKLVVRTELL